MVLEDGRSPDISLLTEGLGMCMSRQLPGRLSRIWSTASELAHVEKKGGRERPLNEVIFAARLVFSAAALPVSYVPRLRQTG